MIVLATANPHKVQELRSMLAGTGIAVIAAKDAGFTEEIEETGETLEANALLKARRVAKATGLAALADDTGLEVEALGGAPGVRSARFAGEACSPADNRALLLEQMRDVPDDKRRAVFRCVLAMADGRHERIFTGECSGVITREEHGAGGFGYDAVFQPDGMSRTMAELAPDQKNAISHRGRALRAFVAAM